MASQERYEEQRDDQGTEGQVQSGGLPPAAVPAGAPRDEAGSADPESHEPMGGTADLLGGTGDLPGSSDNAGSQGQAGTMSDSDTTPLLPPEETGQFLQQWESIQVGFVDQPRQSVEQADQLVADLMRQLAESFARQRSSLEADWDRGDDVSTEELRLCLQRYRSFFQRLLAA